MEANRRPGGQERGGLAQRPLPPDAINAQYLVKEREKPKFKPRQIVELMREGGFPRFSIYHHTKLWQERDAKREEGRYGTQLPDGSWYWYETWVEVVREHCIDNRELYT